MLLPPSLPLIKLAFASPSSQILNEGLVDNGSTQIIEAQIREVPLYMQYTNHGLAFVLFVFLFFLLITQGVDLW